MVGGERHSPIMENKRLSHVLQTARVMQVQCDDRHASNIAHRTNSGRSPYAEMPWPAPTLARDSQTQAQTKAALRTAGAAQCGGSLHRWF